MKVDPSDVQNFYDDFLESRLIDYRIHGNRRIEHALKRILQYVNEDSRVVDIGCGIGIISEVIGKKVQKGSVLACDISARNIWYAAKTVKLSNVCFEQLDVINEFDRLFGLIGDRGVDVIVMVDVIEHLPKDELERVFSNLRSILNLEGKIILTFPSPYYQQYLYDHDREELQLIDEKIELLELAALAAGAELTVKHYSLEDVWRKDQYVHCVLEKVESVSKVSLLTDANPGSFHQIVAAVKYHTLIPIRRRKYIDQIFKNK